MPTIVRAAPGPPVHEADVKVKVPLGLGGLKMTIEIEKLEERPPDFASMNAKGKGVGALMNRSRPTNGAPCAPLGRLADGEETERRDGIVFALQCQWLDRFDLDRLGDEPQRRLPDDRPPSTIANADW